MMGVGARFTVTKQCNHKAWCNVTELLSSGNPGTLDVPGIYSKLLKEKVRGAIYWSDL